MPGKQKNIEDIADSGYVDLAVVLVVTLLTRLFFLFTFGNYAHFYFYTLWCAPHPVGLGLIQDFLLLYVALLNWLAIRFFVMRRPAFGTGWAGLTLKVVALAAVGAMTYNLILLNQRIDCRMQREPAIRSALSHTQFATLVPPKGLEPRMCQWPFTCWARDGHMVSPPFPSVELSLQPEWLRRKTRTATDAHLKKELEKCIRDVKLAFLPDIVTPPDLKNFDFTFLREDPYGRALILVDIKRPPPTEQVRHAAIVHYIGGQNLRAIVCFFQGTDYKRFELLRRLDPPKDLRRDRKELDRLDQAALAGRLFSH